MSPPKARAMLLHAWLYWAITDVVNPLVSCCFYCTEAEGRGNEMLFFHKVPTPTPTPNDNDNDNDNDNAYDNN